MRFGILGTARIADTLIPAIRSVPGCSVAAAASRDPDRARRWAGARDIPHAFGTYADLLASGTVDAVYVALPNSLHAEWTLAAIRAGLPVLCEKPFACTAGQAGLVADAADAARVVVAEAFMHRFHPLHDRVLDVVRGGRIGDVTRIDSVFAFRLDDRGEIPASAALAGGALMDVGCYCVEFSRRVAGREPIRASALERRTSVDDTL
jgi:predicted dehydrogenase